MKHQIAIVGNKDTIFGFKALGLDTFNADTIAETVEILFDLKNQVISENNEERPRYAIIFVTEEFAMEINKDDYKKLSQKALPAIIPVPGSKGSAGYGIKRIGKMVEQAVGSDIINE